MNILKSVFVIIGTLIGAGFASGKEVYVFFYSFGIKGLLGIAISGILIGIITYKTFLIVEKNKINNYKEFLEVIVKYEKIQNITNILINIFILISFYIMVAGFGAYLKQELQVTQLLGSSILAGLCYIILKKDIKGLIMINEILIPILIFIVVFIRNVKYKEN